VDKEEDEHDARPSSILACPDGYISYFYFAARLVRVPAVLTYDWSVISVNQWTSADAAIDESCTPCVSLLTAT
jgi:hypothetical protein